MKLKDIMAAYLEDIKYEVKKHTYLNYLVIINRIEDDIEIFDDTPKNYLNKYLAEKKYSYTTKSMLKSLINRSLDFAKESGLLSFKHKITLKLQKNFVRKVEALNRQEQNKLEQYIYQKNKPQYFGIIISLYTGIRIGELVSLTWDNVDFKKNTINITQTTSYIAKQEFEDLPKTISSQREIPMASNVKNILKKLKKISNSTYCICGKNNKKLNIRSYQKTFSNILSKLNIKHYGFHSLRHTFASRLMDKKVDVKTISDLMGHAKSDITLSTYIHSTSLQKSCAVTSLVA